MRETGKERREIYGHFRDGDSDRERKKREKVPSCLMYTFFFLNNC